MSTVGKLKETANPRAMTLIREAYYQFAGRPPSSFEALAALPFIRDNTDDSEIIEKIGTQIAFLDIWEELKQKT